TASYGGDASYLSSNSSAVNQVVNKIASTTTLGTSPNPSVSGSSVTLTAIVSPSSATGSVQFVNVATSLGSATVSGGQAQLTLSTLPVGSDSLTASYGGSATYLASTSSAVTQVVKATTTTTL